MSDVSEETLDVAAFVIEECLSSAPIVNHFDNRERMDMRKALDDLQTP